MNAKRILKLSKFLYTVPREKFDMTTWWCGTSGCAMGWACEISEFKKLGLKRSWSPSEYRTLIGFKGESHETAAAKLFDISEDDAFQLFINGKLDTPKQVGYRLRRFVESQLKKPRHLRSKFNPEEV